MYCNTIVLFKPTIYIAIVLGNNSNTSMYCNLLHCIAMDNTLLIIPGLNYIGLVEIGVYYIGVLYICITKTYIGAFNNILVLY